MSILENDFDFTDWPNCVINIIPEKKQLDLPLEWQDGMMPFFIKSLEQALENLQDQDGIIFIKKIKTAAAEKFVSTAAPLFEDVQITFKRQKIFLQKRVYRQDLARVERFKERFLKKVDNIDCLEHQVLRSNGEIRTPLLAFKPKKSDRATVVVEIYRDKTPVAKLLEGWTTAKKSGVNVAIGVTVDKQCQRVLEIYIRLRNNAKLYYFDRHKISASYLPISRQLIFNNFSLNSRAFTFYSKLFLNNKNN